MRRAPDSVRRKTCLSRANKAPFIVRGNSKKKPGHDVPCGRLAPGVFTGGRHVAGKGSPGNAEGKRRPRGATFACNG